MDHFIDPHHRELSSLKQNLCDLTLINALSAFIDNLFVIFSYNQSEIGYVLILVEQISQERTHNNYKTFLETA